MFRLAGLGQPAALRYFGLLLALALICACANQQSTKTESESRPTIAPSQSVAQNQFFPPFDLGAGFPVGLAIPRDTDLLQEGMRTPVFEMEFADGAILSTEDLAGRALLINFWATWCGPCRHEIPIILEQQALHPEELLVLAVNIKEDREKVEEFASAFAMDIPVILDPPGSIVSQFEVRGYPTSIFVSASGKLVATWRGVLDAAKLEELVNASLAIDDKNP